MTVNEVKKDKNKQPKNDKKDEKRNDASSIYEAMYPAQTFLRFTGSICYYRNKTTRKFKKSYVLCFFNCIYLIGQIFFTVHFYKIVPDKIFYNSFKFVYYLQRVAPVLSMFSIIFGQIFTMKKTEVILALEKIDSKFKSFGEGSKLSKANAKIVFSCKVRIAIAIFSFLMIEILTYLVKFHEYRKMFHFIRVFFDFVPDLMQEIELSMFFCAIKSRFKVINQIFKEKIEESKQVDKYPINKYLFSRWLKVLLDQHEDLRKITEKLNKIFGFQLLYFTLNIISLLIFYGIRFISAILSGDSYELCLLPCRIIIIVLLVSVLAIVYQDADKVSTEANETLFLMHGIQVRVDDTDSIKLLILSTIYMNNNKLKITVFGLFGIDFALILIICGSAFSYLVITFQFLQHRQINRIEAMPFDVNLTNSQLLKSKL